MKKLLCAVASVLLLTTFAFAADETVIAPSGALLTDDGTLLFTDTYNHAIWEQETDGTYTKLAGRDGVLGADNRPMGAYHDDEALDAAFNTPWAIAPYADGYAITDSENNVIRYYADGEVTTLAGSGSAGLKNATGVKATFDRPTGLVADDDGGLYVADSDNHVIRYISSTGVVTTYAGSGSEGMADGSLTKAQFSDPTGLAYVDGVLYVCDTGNHRICKIEDGQVTTLLGGTDGYDDGNIDDATLSSPTGVAVYGNILYIADTGNSAVRCVTDDLVTTLTVAGDTQLFPISPRGLVVDGGTLWICDVFSHTLSSVSSTALSFTDVPSTAWFANAVYYMKAHGCMNGTTDTTFSPYSTMTRAMFAQVLYNMEGATPVNYLLPFTDASDAWYTEAVRWAASEGIVNGTTDTTYSPDTLINRQQLVVMLYRYAQWQGMEDDGTTSASITGFSDYTDVSDYAYDAMEWAYGVGVINGTATGTLNPYGQATRAEAATMLMNFMEADW